MAEAAHKPIAFIDLAAQQARIRDAVEQAMQTVLDHGRYINGPEVGALETALADFVGSAHCVGCSSGTDALVMALLALEIGPGDAVITSPFTFFATCEAIASVGATPVFADIESDSYNLDPARVAEVAQAVAARQDLRLAAIMTVDLFGLPADYEAIGKIAAEYEVPVIQDAAQSFGALYQGARVPTQGLIGCTSFFPAKPLGCYGDGGACFTDDAELDAKLRSIRVHGQGTDKYDNIRLGLNARLDTLQAAILLEKLKLYPEEIALRSEVAARYATLIEALNSRVQIPVVPEGYSSVFAQYTIGLEARDAVQASLKQAGVPTAIYYQRAMHLLEAMKPYGGREGDQPVAEAASRRVLSLPFHPYLDEATQVRIVEALKHALQ